MAHPDPRRPPSGARHEASVPTVQRARLVPPRRPGRWLPRPRLLEALDPAGNDGIVVIHAAAGAGKSTLVSDWLASRRHAAAWLTLDPRDNALPALVVHLVAALRQIAPGVGVRTLALLGATATPDTDTIRRTVVDEVYDLPAGAYVVLDDLHHLAPGPSLELVAGILRFPPPQTRWILLGRDPLHAPGPLLKSRATMREIRLPELLFTADETRDVLARGPAAPVTADAAARIQALTDGWPALVHLAADRLPPAATAADVDALLAGDGLRDPGAFLAAEVVDRLPPATRTVALATAICESFSPALARALVAPLDPRIDPGAALVALARAGAVTAVASGQAGTVRWRPMVRAIARDLLEQRHGRDVVRRQHAIAACWLADAGDAAAAVAQALLADDAHLAGKIAADAGFALLASERWGALAAIIRALPPDLVERRADLLALRAWVDWSRGAIGSMALAIRRANEILPVSGLSPVAQQQTSGYLAAIGSVLSVTPPQPDATIAAAGTVFAALPPGENVGRGFALQSLAIAAALAGRPGIAERELAEAGRGAGMFSSGLGARVQIARAHLAYLCSDDHDAVRDLLIDGVHQAARFDLPITAELGHAWLASIALLRLDLDAAAAHLGACRLGPDDATVPIWRDVQCASALLLALRGEHIAAAALMADAVTYLAALPGTEPAAIARSFQARLALMRGDTEQALDWALSAPIAIVHEPLALIEAAAITAIRALAASSNPVHRSRALERATIAVTTAAAQHHRPLLATALATRATVRASLGDLPGALADLDTPLTDLARNRAPLRLLELGPPLADLLRALPATHPHSVLAATLAGQISTTPRDRICWTATAIDRPLALSPRELAVLTHLAAPLGNKEIADALHISPATVKIHVASLLAKLGVANRTEAAQRARALGLVEPMRSR